MNALLRRLLPWCCAVLAISLTASAGASAPNDAAQSSMRRYALIASANDGGKDRPQLRFADSDARATARVLQSLGGVRDSDVILLPSATRASLEAAFSQLGARITLGSAAPRRSELFVYYSGHSDELGLLLAGERVAYSEMRSWIDATHAEVRIAVLDSCASGAVIRERGGVHRPPFLSDLSVNARGHAFLTASSADEAAQESDRIQGGFFTHYFLSGLRGAADASRDGRITLAEAYQFSYDETLRRTAAISGRAQHPAYDIQLAGTGDLVLTDLRSNAARLVLEESLEGRIFVRDGAGRLMVELHKQPRYPVQLGFDAGAYDVLLDRDEQTYRAHVVLSDGATVHLTAGEFAAEEGEPLAARGADGSGPDEEREPRSLLDLPFSFGGYAGINLRYSRLMGEDRFVAGAEMALLFFNRLAIGIAGYGSDPDPGETLSFGYGGAIVRYHFPSADRAFYLSLAALTAAGEISESANEDDRFDDSVFVFEPQLSGHMNVTRWLRFGVDGGYRFVTGTRRFRERDFRGPMAGFHMQLGWF
jgi:hypothetical protein